jgi:hypothetical protein
MNVLDIIEDINIIRNNAIKFAQGDISQEELRISIGELVKNLSKTTNQPIKQEGIKSPPPEEVKQPIIDKSFYFNESNKLLYKLEIDKKGVAFSEAHGYVIFVPNEQLKTLSPMLGFTDSNKLYWELKETNDEKVVKAINEIGDEVIGFIEVQELIDGQSAMEIE